MVDIRVLLVDDHAVLRSGLKLLLNLQKDIHVLAEADNGLEAINLASELKPDVILLDLTMPGMGGFEALASLQKIAPESKVLVLTMHDDESYLRRVLSSGAAGYILKKAADAELMSAIRAVNRGEIYIHSAMTHALLNGVTPLKAGKVVHDGELWERLSDREREVLGLVAHGHTNAEIAKKLSLSIKTIETYRARVMEKLGLRSRASLVKYALRLGILGE